MAAHVADRILFAVRDRLAAAGIPCLIEPARTLSPLDLPAALLRDIEDETIESTGGDPVFETRRLSFDAFVCDAANSTVIDAEVADLHLRAEFALLGSPEGRRLDGLLTRGLKRLSARRVVDIDSLQLPVGGWAIRFECTYGLRSDAPGLVEKEL